MKGFFSEQVICSCLLFVPKPIDFVGLQIGNLIGETWLVEIMISNHNDFIHDKSTCA